MTELEFAVMARWDREAIAVYGDHLMSIGDPRGELVAMDLRIEQEGASPAVVARRNELIAAWFGDRLPPGIVRYGFVDVDATSATPDSQLALALGGPGAAYVRSVAIAGAAGLVARSIQMLAEAPRPWLTKLVVRQWDESALPTIEDAALAAALPHLAELEVEGRRVFAELAPPRLRTLRISGFDAIALGRSGAPLAVESLDFAFHCHFAREHEAPKAGALRSLLPAARFPALRDLDLSRNEPGRLAPYTLGGDLDVFSFLDNLAVRRQLEELRLPPLISSNDLAKLAHALEDMPALRELVVYGVEKRLAHPTATIRFAKR